MKSVRTLMDALNELVSESQLRNLAQQDQQARREYQEFVQTQADGDWAKGAEMYARVRKRSPDDLFGDRERHRALAKMKLDFESFSDQDWNDYWILVQHFDFDRKFQKQALAIIEKHLGTDNDYYRYLYDRISCALTASQKYNTQDICQRD